MAAFTDRRLAARLEHLCALEMLRFVQTARSIDPRSPADSLEVGGGVAAFVSPTSALNQAFGLGFDAEVSDEHVEAIGRFYGERGVPPLIGASPLADPSLFVALARRGWVVDAFENVLVRTCGPDAPDESADIEIREMVDDEGRELWKRLAATAFSAPLPPTAEQLEVAHLAVRRPGSRLFVAFVEGVAAGTGELYCDDGIAWLSGDATMPHYRRRGVQRALQMHRLAVGSEDGCEIAVTEATPGSGSQRNSERLGFTTAYTRVDLTLRSDGGHSVR